MVEKIKIECRINGKPMSLNAYPMARLLDVIREEGKLVGSKEGCGEGECGACAILINGELVNSCLVPAIQADGTDITTVEGIAENGELNAIQQSFVEEGGAQCGMCTPGMMMAAVYLLKKNPNPSEEEMRTAFSGNLCRCTGYTKIFSAIVKSVQKTKGRS